jgi:4,5-dihydroxyphthalate decarboxylase
MATLRLSAISGDYDRIEALKTGKIKPDGCELDYTISDPGSTFQRLFRKQEFDITEMSFSTYMLALSKGGFSYRAVPVFLSRVFPHCSIYIRTDRGIEGPRDLRGKLVGVPSYHFTRGLVVRGMLQDEYQVLPQDIRWRVGGIDQAEDFSYVDRPRPAGVYVEFAGPGTCLNDELAAGAIDGIISYRDPKAFVERRPRVARLFADFRSVEQDWYHRTRLFPIMHVIGIRTSLLEAHPWLAMSVCAAFQAAKDHCRPRLSDLDALSVMLPWLVAEMEATTKLMGANHWPYGVEENRHVIATQARWSFEQGLASQIFTPEDLFDESTLQWNP